MVEILGAIGSLGAILVWLLQLRRRIRAHASRVTAWVDPRPAFERCGYDGVSVHLSNANKVPISGCCLALRHKAGLAVWIEHGTVAPGAHIEWPADYMLPDAAWDWQIDEIVGVDVWFTDSSGRSWRRHPNGKLVRRSRPADGVMVPATP